jgi:hypothetical protein
VFRVSCDCAGSIEVPTTKLEVRNNLAILHAEGPSRKVTILYLF